MSGLLGRGRPPFVKICGVRTSETIDACAACGVDGVGLVFAEGSPRRLELHEALSLLASMPPSLEPVGLFVDPDIAILDGWPGQWIQLHGRETPERVQAIAAETGHRIIKAIGFDPVACRAWDEHPDVDALLVDGPAGGSGQAFDHSGLAETIAELRTPVIVAGGLDPISVASVVRDCHPFGVDVSSGVESSRGIKSIDLIEAFTACARAAAT